MGKGDSDEKS